MVDKQMIEIFNTCGLKVSNLVQEPEGTSYNAIRYQVNNWHIVGRKAKQTPKKIGQFVTCWKRNRVGATVPLAHTDAIDFYVIHVENPTANLQGYFIFPKTTLSEQGILSTDTNNGKRGFRVYPLWDTVTSKQAVKTQLWQQQYFFSISNPTNIEQLIRLFSVKKQNPKH